MVICTSVLRYKRKKTLNCWLIVKHLYLPRLCFLFVLFLLSYLIVSYLGVPKHTVQPGGHFSTLCPDDLSCQNVSLLSISCLTDRKLQMFTTVGRVGARHSCICSMDWETPSARPPGHCVPSSHISSAPVLRGSSAQYCLLFTLAVSPSHGPDGWHI